VRVWIGADDGDRVVVLLRRGVLVRGEVVEAGLYVRQDPVAVVHQDHRIVLGGNGDLALSGDLPRGGDDARHGDDGLGRAEQAGQRRQIVDGQVRQAASAFGIEERRPVRAQMTVTGVCRRQSPQFPLGQRLGHEGKLRALYYRRRAPETNAFRAGKLQEPPARGERVGDGLLAPDVSARLQGLFVQPLVFLHVRKVDEQKKGGSRQHLVDVRIVMRDLVPVRRLAGTLGQDVAGADQLYQRRTGQVRQVRS
jgi:hypothetical protein